MNLQVILTEEFLGDHESAGMKINNDGTTVLVVTHNREIVNEMQKRVITMKKGLIVSDEEKGGYIDED